MVRSQLAVAVPYGFSTDRVVIPCGPKLLEVFCH
jgi:hypothetical protein